ncbi:MAG: DbpA RNA binding domain-containing protein [Spirochaetales bacterium]
MSPRTPYELDLSNLKPLVNDLQNRLRESGNLDELAAWQQAFRKTVPLFDRSMVAGFLLSQYLGKGGGRRKMDTITVFVSIGKNRRVFPRDLVLLFSTEGQLIKTDIGDIKILDNYSFVEVEEKVAAALISRLDGKTYRGRRLTVNFAKKRPAGESEVRESSTGEELPEEER